MVKAFASRFDYAINRVRSIVELPQFYDSYQRHRESLYDAPVLSTVRYEPSAMVAIELKLKN